MIKETNLQQTQLQILTAVVKLFLKKPSNNQGLVQKVLQLATADSDNPDIRDRAYIYWRLLSGDLDIAKVCNPCPLSPPLSQKINTNRLTRPNRALS
jgi:vesicle coat complex subunit